MKRWDPWLGIGLIVLGLAVGANSLLGPLAASVIEYPLSRTVLNQTLGLDAVSLILVTPLCAVTGVLTLRGRSEGRVLALALALYTAYMFVQYVVGPDYLRHPPVLPLQLGIFVLAEVLAVGAWSAIDGRDLPPASRRREKVLGVLLLALAGFVALRYLPGLVGSLGGEPIPPDAREEPAMYWTIFLLDVGVVVPVTVGAGVSLVRAGAASARKAAYAIVGWFALVGPAVAAMGMAMVLDGDPNASPGTVALFTATAVASLALALWVYRPLFGGAAGGWEES